MERKRSDTIPKYDLEALKANVDRCNQNIVLFQEAIEKERKNKAYLLHLIRELKEGR